MTEDKIREAFDKYLPPEAEQAIGKLYYDSAKAHFTNGYLAMLNSLDFVGSNKVEMLYRLPEGVTKDVS